MTQKMKSEEQPDLLTNLNENLSALVDGEASEWELKRLLAELDRDESFREDSQLHQLTSAALNRADLQGVDLSSKISTALETEIRPFHFASFFKPLGQVAVAASVALFALLGIQQLPLYTNLDETGSAVAELAEQSEIQAVVIPEGFELPPLQAQTVSSTTAVQVNHVSETVDVPSFDKAELDRHIQEAISTHVENTSESLNSVLPLTRQIGTEAQ